MIGIYKITNPKGRIYIGQSIDIEKRFYKYKKLDCKTQIKLYRSILKYGYYNHVFEVIEECKISELNEKERYYQDLLIINLKNSLNCLLTKTTDKSGLMSKESRLKMSKSRTGLKRSKEFIEKIRLINTGKKFSIESRLKMSIAQTGKKQSSETKIKKSNSLKGRLISDKNKKRISELMSKKIICTKTGKIYKSIKECAELNNIKQKTLSAMLTGQNKNKTNFKYL